MFFHWSVRLYLADHLIWVRFYSNLSNVGIRLKYLT